MYITNSVIHILLVCSVLVCERKKNQTIVPNSHCNHVLHHHILFSPYTKVMRSYHVTRTLLRHKYTLLPCHTCNQKKLAYSLTMSHIQNNTQQVYILTKLHPIIRTLHSIIRNKYTFLPSCTQSYATSIHSYQVTPTHTHITLNHTQQVYILTKLHPIIRTLHSVIRNKYTFLPRHNTQSYKKL